SLSKPRGSILENQCQSQAINIRSVSMKIKAFAFAVLLFGGVSIAQADTFVVNSTADDGSANTLRWAIAQNNAHPGGNTIQIVPSASPFRIKLNSLLPPIIGPATVTSTTRGVVIDGGNFIDGNNPASCPGETGGFGPNVRSLQKPGLAVVHSGKVEISNLEITNFCIGVRLLRRPDNPLPPH